MIGAMRTSRAVLVITAALALVSGVIELPARSATAATPAISATSPCAVARTAPRVAHVVWIVLENVGYSAVASSEAPYLRSLASTCGLATGVRAIAHPSLPNYIALTTGSTQGIVDDGEPSSHPLAATSVFSQLNGDWRSFVESMPRPCDTVTSGDYAARHNPAVYFTNLRKVCARNDVTMTHSLDLRAAFTMIIPNVCHDMHSCPIALGDAWLSRVVPSIVASAQYQLRSLVLFILFDENDGDALNHVPVYVVAPSVRRGERVTTAWSNYAVLRTTESLLGLAPLGAAKHTTSMARAFHLGQ